LTRYRKLGYWPAYASSWHVVGCATVRKQKVGDHVLVKLSGGRTVEATIKAVVETTEGMRLQVSFGDETALIYPWQIVIEPS
jgi:hypothetical protein